MTNNELQQIFQTAETNAKNIFDIYEFISNYSDEYLKMPIAKIKPSIYDAYELYCSHKNKWQDILDTILKTDYSSIVEQFNFKDIIEQLPEELKPLFSILVDEFE